MNGAPTARLAMADSHEAGSLRHDDYKTAVTNRLKTARGHIDGILRMIETAAWCPDVMNSSQRCRESSMAPAGRFCATTSKPTSRPPSPQVSVQDSSRN